MRFVPRPPVLIVAAVAAALATLAVVPLLANGVERTQERPIPELSARVHVVQDRGAAIAPRSLHDHAQFMMDFVEAESSTGFHAPETADAERVLAEPIGDARRRQLALSAVIVAGRQFPAPQRK